VATVLDAVGLSDVADRRAGTFSLGMRQRLGLAAALLGDPEVVMLDEPANGLDPDGILWLRAFTRRLADEGRTVFLSSHLMNEVAQTADHVVVIGRGRIIADAPTDVIVEHHGLHDVFVRADRQDDLTLHLVRHGGVVEPADDAIVVRGLASDAIGAIALAEGIALTELTPRQPSLEAAFLELTHDVTLHTAVAGAPQGA
jgi:ABC-2 type transport system ATP-binding protein